MSEGVKTMLSSGIHVAVFAAAEIVFMKAHKQVGSSELEGDSWSEREETKECLECVYDDCSQKLALQWESIKT